MASTNRTPRVPQSDGDVSFDNNIATVTGILGLPFNNPTPVPGAIPIIDIGGEWINQVDPSSLAVNPSVILNKLIWNHDGTLVYDQDNTLTLEV